jgi:hypothetical protein
LKQRDSEITNLKVELQKIRNTYEEEVKKVKKVQLLQQQQTTVNSNTNNMTTGGSGGGNEYTAPGSGAHPAKLN